MERVDNLAQELAILKGQMTSVQEQLREVKAQNNEQLKLLLDNALRDRVIRCEANIETHEKTIESLSAAHRKGVWLVLGAVFAAILNIVMQGAFK
ncbi:MAG: hypothetical protein LBN32_00415 [Helicobacteraceae bacterium]|jgi:hypothetical protein|nr:hypothetical protein [Helicobacteraceae bacterium]